MTVSCVPLPPINNEVLVDTYKLVESVLTEHFGVLSGECRPEKLLDEDLCLDSLELVDFVMMVETCSGVVLETEALNEAQTLGELVEIVAAARVAYDRPRHDQEGTA